MIKLTPTKKDIIMARIIGILILPVYIVYDIFTFCYRYVLHSQKIQLHYNVIKRYHHNPGEFARTTPYCISSEDFVPGEIIKVIHHSNEKIIGKIGVIESYQKDRLCPITAIVEGERQVFNKSDIEIITNMKYV